jgi:iron complex transport system ATP-binding protein
MGGVSMAGVVARLMRANTEIPARPAPGTVALSAAGLGVRIEGRWLVRDVDLDVVAGRVLAVIGPNGAGKSTLLSLLAGDLSPTAGQVWVGDQLLHGVDVTSLARRRAVLPQKPMLSFPFTVADVVAMGRAPWAGTEAEDSDETVIARAMDDAEITGFKARRFPTLSGGEQAQTSFARILAQQVGVLLLDEPTAALDLRHQEQLMRIAEQSARAGQAVLVVLHDIQLAAAYADEIAVMADGRLAARGTPETVLTEELLEGVYRLPIDVFRHPEHGGLIVAPRRGSRESRWQEGAAL